MKTKTTIEKMYQTLLDKNNEHGDSDDFYLAGMIDILDWALHSDVSDKEIFENIEEFNLNGVEK